MTKDDGLIDWEDKFLEEYEDVSVRASILFYIRTLLQAQRQKTIEEIISTLDKQFTSEPHGVVELSGKKWMYLKQKLRSDV